MILEEERKESKEISEYTVEKKKDQTLNLFQKNVERNFQHISVNGLDTCAIANIKMLK